MRMDIPPLDAMTIAVCSATALGSALYVCFGRVAIRAIIALFVCMGSVSGVLVALGQEYLGFLSLFVAVAGVGALLLYSSSIIGNIQEEHLETPPSARMVVARIFGLIAGLSGGALAAALLLGGGVTLGSATPGATAMSMGSVMMGDHAVSFILMSSACLGIMMGVGILVREVRR